MKENKTNEEREGDEESAKKIKKSSRPGITAHLGRESGSAGSVVYSTMHQHGRASLCVLLDGISVSERKRCVRNEPPTLEPRTFSYMHSL